MEDLTVDLVGAIPTRIMAEERGDCRLISGANLHHLVFYTNLIPDCLPRAAFIFSSLTAYPAFREGNKRIAQKLSAKILGTGGNDIDIPPIRCSWNDFLKASLPSQPTSRMSRHGWQTMPERQGDYRSQ